MLQGPIDIQFADKVVSPSFSGVFVLSTASTSVAYVGSAASGIADAVKKAAQSAPGCGFFGYEYTKTPEETFLKECQYYHKYNPKANTSHPQPPAGSTMRCPVCSK